MQSFAYTMRTIFKRLNIFFLALILSGCASQVSGPLRFDDSMKSRGQSGRIDIIVLHYTASTKPSALMTLTNRDVSAHYVVTDDKPPIVYRLVSEDKSAWHAGESSWYGKTFLNQRSIGIEIVHPGWTKNSNGDKGMPYSDTQIAAVIELTRDIAKRNNILPENIVGHSDIAPMRKIDPGPSFPWKKLAQAGVGRWFDEAAAAKYEANFIRTGYPDAGWFQKQLKRVGYQVPESNYFDGPTLAAIGAFQMHYRPDRVTSRPDPQTAARLMALPTTGSGL